MLIVNKSKFILICDYKTVKQESERPRKVIKDAIRGLVVETGIINKFKYKRK